MKRQPKNKTTYPTNVTDDASYRVCESAGAGYMAPATATLADVWEGFRRMQEEDRIRWAQLDKWREELEKFRREEAKCQAEESKRRAEEDAKRQAAEEKRREEEDAKRQAEEEKRREEEDAKRQAEDAKRQAEEAKRQAADEKRREEAAKELKESRARMLYLENLFVGQWGKLMEQLVNGDLVRLLKEKDINIEQTSTRTRGRVNGENFEFDIIAHDGDTIVIVEVKTTLQPDDVKDFIDRLNRARTLLPLYKDKRILGAVGYLTENANASRMAQKDGLFAIQAAGGSAFIVNDEKFVPKAF